MTIVCLRPAWCGGASQTAIHAPSNTARHSYAFFILRTNLTTRYIITITMYILTVLDNLSCFESPSTFLYGGECQSPLRS